MSRNNWPERSPMGPRHGSPAFASKQSKHNTHYFWQSPKLITIIIFFFAAIIRSSCLLDVAPLFFLAGSRGLAAMNYQSLCNRLHVIAMRLEDESVDLEILPPLEAQKCLKTATWRDGMGRNCLKGMCWYITNFQLYIYNYMVIYVCMIYVGLRKSLHETTIYTYIYT